MNQSANDRPLLEVTDLEKTYRHHGVEVRAVRGVSFVVEHGEFVSIMGPSGCGKSTLLYLLSGMAAATGGSVKLEGQDLVQMTDAGRTRLRREAMGFVFQRFNLMPTLTVLGNLQLAARLKKVDLSRPEAEAILERVGLLEKARVTPRYLSEGQKQRASIARAIVVKAPLVFADEPTGSLDSDNSDRIMELFFELNRDGQTLVMVTHNRELARRTGRILTMRDGQLTDNERIST